MAGLVASCDRCGLPTLSETIMESAELALGGATHVARPRKAAK